MSEKIEPKAKKTKKRNPADATMRNVRAVNKRLAEIEQRLDVALEYCWYLHSNLREKVGYWPDLLTPAQLVGRRGRK